MFSEIAEIPLVAARLGQFLQFLKTRVILILNFTRPHAITHTKSEKRETGHKPLVVALCSRKDVNCPKNPVKISFMKNKGFKQEEDLFFVTSHTTWESI